MDLGASPPSNSYLSFQALSEPEKYYPLRVLVCTECWLVQTEDFARAEDLFNSDYAYFSSVSDSWLKHAKSYCREITQKLGLCAKSFVIEIASNDGYLLKNFLAAGIPCLGIEPTESTAAVAELAGIPVMREFFTASIAQTLATRGNLADLIIGNNVYAHVPNINDFTLALKIALKVDGVITLEFPHVMRLIEKTQFDTIYHEHFSYLSLTAVQRIFEKSGLRIWDVEELPTHGGSLRVFGCHAEHPRVTGPAVSRILLMEKEYGLLDVFVYQMFQPKVERVKDEIISFLLEKKKSGKKVAAYGAAAKGNTLLNFGGVRSDLLNFVCDAAPSKQGKFLPGSRIPIVSPEILRVQKPDFVVIMPWNIEAEVVEAHSYIKSWGGRFVVAVPQLRVLPPSVD